MGNSYPVGMNLTTKIEHGGFEVALEADFDLANISVAKSYPDERLRDGLGILQYVEDFAIENLKARVDEVEEDRWLDPENPYDKILLRVLEEKIINDDDIRHEINERVLGERR